MSQYLDHGGEILYWPIDVFSQPYSKIPAIPYQVSETKTPISFEEADPNEMAAIRFANPQTDMMFKSLFSEQCNALVIRLLNEIFDFSGKDSIEQLSFLKASNVRDFDGEKITYVDILCTNADGNSFVVEMQNQFEKSYLKRVIYYGAREYVRQLKCGTQSGGEFKQNYGDLRPVYVVSFLSHTVFFDNPDYLSHHKILNTKNHQQYLKGLNWAFIELSKFNKENGKIFSALDEFLYLLKNWYRIYSYPDTTQIKEAYKILDQSTWTKEKMDDFERSLFQKESYEDTLEARWEEGGREMKKMIAKRMLLKGFNVSEVATLTEMGIEGVMQIKRKGDYL